MSESQRPATPAPRDEMTRRDALCVAAGAAGTGWLAGRASAAATKPRADTLSFRRDLPISTACDVVVCGGGPAGTAAAIAARRAGARVLLVESQGQLGGMGTSGLVSHWLGGRTSDCKRWVVGGLFRRLARQAAERGIALLPQPKPGRKYQPHGWYRGQLEAGIPFDPFAMAAFLDEQLAAAGADVLLLTQAVDARVEGGRITHVVIFNKSGLSAVRARAVVDATGDADLAARTGCPVVKGRHADALTAPATLQFHVSGVDTDALSAYIHAHDAPRFRREIRELRAAGEWTFPYEILISVELTEKGTMLINTSRLVGVDGTDGASMTRGMVRGRAETQKLLALLRKHFPGFAHARLKAVAPLLGVRESRRIRGEFVLTVEHVTGGREFDDTIGWSAYGWDLPNPKRPSHNPSHGRKRPVTPVPYRTMLPRGPANLICPGRAISVERAVLGPLRVMAPCMAMGEAAGQAAAEVAAGRGGFADVDVKALRNTLRSQGAIVDWEA